MDVTLSGSVYSLLYVSYESTPIGSAPSQARKDSYPAEPCKAAPLQKFEVPRAPYYRQRYQIQIEGKAHAMPLVQKACEKKAASQANPPTKQRKPPSRRPCDSPDGPKPSPIQTTAGDSEFWLRASDLEDQEQLARVMLDHIVQHRIIRDDEYDELFERVVERFPSAESLVKGTLLEIVAYLDS